MNAHKKPDGWGLLRQLFGDNRAEFSLGQTQHLFVEPPYFSKLESLRPCFLIGGRGTGKTTALQSLRYDATLRRLEDIGLSFGDQNYAGIMVRMNKNRVRAFDGKRLPDEEWPRLFAHYINLLICLELTRLATWLEERAEVALSKHDVSAIGLDLGLGDLDSLDRLAGAIRQDISRLQLYVNNPSSSDVLTLSIAESPVRTTVDILASSGLLGPRVVFVCFDEYENLLPYQQAVLNTYIKHASPPLSYKVGVRKNGLRSHHTLDGDDVLNNPDDYAQIEIAEEGFEYFARAVAEYRLQYARQNGVSVPEQLKDFLPSLALSEEVALLGGNDVARGVLNELERTEEEELVRFFNEKPSSETYFLRYWAETGSESVADLARDWMADPGKWTARIGNYGFASLFWLSVGRKGARIRKYYCGERVLLALAGGNIRYFLDLLDTSISTELSGNDSGQLVKSGELVLSPKSQTLAAREVGRRRLNLLEGSADHGPKLKRLVLAIGKVFFEKTRSPTRGTPEQNSFVLSGAAKDIAEISVLLSEGVGHLAFEVEARTKATSSLEMKDDEFRLHRIFSAFFEISHRKKRRMSFDAGHLLDVLADHPARAISALLDDRPVSEDDSLPEQLAFFSSFYEESK